MFLAFSIEAFFNTRFYVEVRVLTYNQDLVNIALQFGAKVPFFKSVTISKDYSISADVLIEVLFEYQKWI